MKSSYSYIMRGGAQALPLLLIALGACGENGWTDLPTGGIARNDVRAPAVEILSPDSAAKIAVGDSARVRVRLSDDVALDSLVLQGFERRGNPELGTDTLVARFGRKVVDFRRPNGAVRDTTIERYLLATADSAEAANVIIMATVWDTVGNFTTEQVEIAIGGPRVQILDPTRSLQLRAQTQLRVRIAARDTVSRLDSIGLRLRRAGGGEIFVDTMLALEPPVGRVDTVISFTVPASAVGDAELVARVRNLGNETSTSAAVPVEVLGAAADQTPPTVTFSVDARPRSERRDTVVIRVSATDSTRVDRVGARVIASHRLPSGTVALADSTFVRSGESAAIRFTLGDLGLPVPVDTSTVRLEVRAFAYDAAGNCAAASTPGTPLSESCTSDQRGARTEIAVVRGGTIRPAAGSLLVDLVADSAGRRVFVSNFERNRLEILPFGDSTFTGSVAVGAEPWGVGIGVNGDTLYVANSASVNISVVPLSTLSESYRINPPNVRLYDVDYNTQTDSVNAVTPVDYSDRPQFLGQIATGQLLYSTKPTSVREPGTIRIFDRTKDQTDELNRGSEIFTGYATVRENRAIVVNALSATAGNSLITVCPRRLTETQSDPACITGLVSVVSARLTDLRNQGLTDTRVDLRRSIESVALSDTTFVAVSGDNSAVAFGEGGVDPGRVFFFQSVAGQLVGSNIETEDLIGNNADRVISLGLNLDGSLGVARGQRAYFFEDDLRLQGQVPTGTVSPAGGSALHPLNADYPAADGRRRAFVSGVDADGNPYLDVIDAYSFVSLRRIHIRDRIVGPLVATPVDARDPEAGTLALRVFGITPTGVVQVGLTPSDIQ